MYLSSSINFCVICQESCSSKIWQISYWGDNWHPPDAKRRCKWAFPFLTAFFLRFRSVVMSRLPCCTACEAAAIYSWVEASSCNNDRHGAALIHGDLCNMANNTLPKTCLNYESDGGQSLSSVQNSSGVSWWSVLYLGFRTFMKANTLKLIQAVNSLVFEFTRQ